MSVVFLDTVGLLGPASEKALYPRKRAGNPAILQAPMSFPMLDSVIAQWDTTDQWHALAEAAYRQIKAQRKSVVTTTFIMLECGNTAARRTFRADVCALRQALELRNELIVPTDDDWKQAWTDYEQGLAGQAGIVDHVSFVVMRRLGITDAFTNDRHFQAAGFTMLF